jgi:PAS domain S-box-containing protein
VEKINILLDANSGVLVCETSGKVLLCNEKAARIFGGQATDLEDTQISELLLDVLDDVMPGGHYRQSLSDISTQTGWQRFNAISLNGWVFPVMATVASFKVDNTPLFLLRLINPSDARSRPTENEAFQPTGASLKSTCMKPNSRIAQEGEIPLLCKSEFRY